MKALKALMGQSAFPPLGVPDSRTSRSRNNRNLSSPYRVFPPLWSVFGCCGGGCATRRGRRVLARFAGRARASGLRAGRASCKFIHCCPTAVAGPGGAGGRVGVVVV